MEISGWQELCHRLQRRSEAIADLCHFSEQENIELAGRINALATTGLRVIGVAKAEFTAASLPGSSMISHSGSLALSVLQTP